MKNDSWALALRVMVNLSAWIAGPVIIALFLGRWLDERYNTAPWLFLGTMGFAFLISMYGLVTNALKEFKKIEADAKSLKDNKREEKEKK